METTSLVFGAVIGVTLLVLLRRSVRSGEIDKWKAHEKEFWEDIRHDVDDIRQTWRTVPPSKRGAFVVRSVLASTLLAPFVGLAIWLGYWVGDWV